jgi:FlaA1/EpsC-like NDP-sugar epimerase
LFKEASTRFTALRFGNVLGSRGSLIPILQQQIRDGGPVTITHPAMERFYMTSTEAVFLILASLIEAKNSDILALDMGDPIRLLDVVRAVFRLAGLEPDIDIPIKFVGPRPGEKPREELLSRGELAEPTGHPRIQRIRSLDPIDEGALRKGINLLKDSGVSAATEDIRQILGRLVPTYVPMSERELEQALSPAISEPSTW